MAVSLEAIKFNYDPNSVAHDAFNIRVNETESVTVPEWRRNETTAPSAAAYAIKETADSQISIQAKFRRHDSNISRIEVQAIDPTGKNILGEVQARPATFSDEVTDYISFNLEKTRIQEAGVSASTTTWEWQYRLSASSSWLPLETTKHRIFTTLRVPQPPWVCCPYNESNTQLPWTEILEFVCKWAAGAKSYIAVATKLTNEFRNLEKRLSIFYWPSPPYYSNPNFDATQFLDLLRGGRGKSYRLNCSDCATALSTFANIVGCDLWQAWMGHNFITKPVMAIGAKTWQAWRFNYHEVAWQFPCGSDDPIYDASLKLNSEKLPNRQPRPSLPVNVPFGQADQEHYRFMLAVPPGDQPNPAWPQPFPDERRHRAVAPNPSSGLRVHPELLQILTELYKFDDWKLPARSSEQMFLDNLYLPPDFFLNWNQLQDEQMQMLTSDWPLTVHTLLERQEDTDLRRIDRHVCANAADARSFLMLTLAQFECPTLNPLDGLGEVAFLNPEDESIVFARANLVFLIRNVGEKNESLLEMAKTLDQETLREPNSEFAHVQPMQHFSVSTEKFLAGRTVPIDIVDQSSQVRMHKFLTPDGKISLQENQYVYEPFSSGPQRLTIFGIGEDGYTSLQHLEFEATLE
jgi:hypothetical protein